MALPVHRPLVCLVTDRRRLGAVSEAAAAERLVRLAGAAASAGVDLFQVREPDVSGRDLGMLVTRCLDVAAGSRLQVLVNDRLDVALITGAHGAHLRSDSVPAAAARRLCPGRFLLGRSVHGVVEAQAVEREGGLDYLVFGTVFATASKAASHALAGLDGLARVTKAVTLPVLAIGGVTIGTVASIWPAGAAGLAAIGLFVEAPGGFDGATAALASRVRWLRESFDSSRPLV